MIDRVAWGSSTAGGYIEAGLPNITGNLSTRDANDTYGKLVGVDGAFQNLTDTQHTFGIYYTGSTERFSEVVNFDASKSNAIYGNSSTVQPPAAKLIPIIKY